jgi:L-lysine 2,3-aminomutase
MPAFNPFRFLNDPDLLELLARHSQPDRRIYFMCHFDHPNELTKECREGLQLIMSTGVICVNQNPIIRGISDCPDTMATLWNELSYLGIPQYYVFQGRPTAGNEPFELPIVEAYFKIEEAKRKCSGLAKRTKYVMSHESGKIEILGVDRERIYLKYHRARYSRDEQRMIVCRRDDKAYWFDQLQPIEGTAVTDDYDHVRYKHHAGR